MIGTKEDKVTQARKYFIGQILKLVKFQACLIYRLTNNLNRIRYAETKVSSSRIATKCSNKKKKTVFENISNQSMRSAMTTHQCNVVQEISMLASKIAEEQNQVELWLQFMCVKQIV